MSLFKDISSIAFDPLGSISSVATSLINAHSQKETNKSNAYQNQLSREFTEQQAQLDRDFNAQQSLLQNQFNAREAEKSRYFNADQAAKQMEFQKEMWNQENEYNDPSNQIARLKRAGVNPNWVDGLDNTAGSVSGGAAATSSPASGSLASHSSLGAPSSIPMQPVTVENPLVMASQIRLANAQADKAEQDAERTKKLLPGEYEAQGFNLRLMDSNINVNQATVESLASSSRLNDQKVAESQETVKFMQMNEDEKKFALAHLEERWQNELSELARKWTETNSRVQLDKASIKEAVSQAAFNYANAQNAQDMHILNGVQLRFVSNLSEGQLDELAFMKWNETKQQYDLVLDDVETSKLENKRTRQRVGRRNVDNWYNITLDYISDIDDALGRPFGAGFNFGYRKVSKD